MPAPELLISWTIMLPIAPGPMTTQKSPSLTAMRWTPCTAQASGSVIAASSKETLSGILWTPV